MDEHKDSTNNENKEPKKLTPILPYDFTSSEKFKMYDNAAYVANRDAINEYREIDSEHMIKGYRCEMSKVPLKIFADMSNEKTPEDLAENNTDEFFNDITDETTEEQ